MSNAPILVGVLGLPGILLGPLAITYFFELVRLYGEEYGTRAVAPEDGSPVARRMSSVE